MLEPALLILNTILLIAVAATAIIFLRRDQQPNQADATDSLRDELDALRKEQAAQLQDAFDRARKENAESDQRQRQELIDTLDKLAGQQGQTLKQFAERLDKLTETSQSQSGQLRESLDKRMHTFGESQSAQMQTFGERLGKLTEGTTKQAEQLRDAIQKSLDTMRKGNEEKLEKMRVTVDEKLQGTLEKRLGESFKLVSERLEKVQRGLGEMQELAKGVGDLKRVMTNVKTRGTWGEYQLASLLEQVLTPDQYEANVKVIPGKDANVEFAVKLPGSDDEHTVWLPIDAKFPQEDYERLQAAADLADAAAMDTARKELLKRVRLFAKEINNKYIAPPHTTAFAFLFVPTEGLYAELAREPGFIDNLQRTFRVSIAGPSTLLAQLNALQMGFRTLAIQERSAEVWQVLGAVKTEFSKFGDALAGVKKKLEEASNKVNQVETRTRVMTRTLKTVEALPGEQTAGLLSLDEDVPNT